MDLAKLDYQELTREMLRVSTATRADGTPNPAYDIRQANIVRTEMQRRITEQTREPTAAEVIAEQTRQNVQNQLTGAREHLNSVLKNAGPAARELAERVARKSLDDIARQAKAAGIPIQLGDCIHEIAGNSWLG